MATSANPQFERFSPTTQVCLHAGLKVSQLASMVVPPAYILMAFVRRRPVTVTGLMHRSVAAVLAGSGAGYAVGYLRLNGQSPEAIEDRVYRLKHNASQVRCDDYSVIGGALGMLLSPAIFLRRAPLLSLVAGGAAIGLGAGVWAHMFQSVTQGQELAAKGMVSELPELPGKDKK